MRKHLLTLVMGAAIAALTTFASAQTIVPNQWTGNECWNAGQGPGGPGTFVCLYGARNATGYQLVTLATLGSFTPLNTVNQVLLAVQPSATMTISTPTPPYDAELFSVCNVTNAALAATAVTLAPTSPQVFAAGVTTTLTTLAARTCVEIQYSLSNTTWYQIR